MWGDVQNLETAEMLLHDDNICISASSVSGLTVVLDQWYYMLELLFSVCKGRILAWIHLFFIILYCNKFSYKKQFLICPYLNSYLTNFKSFLMNF
jgi:hypothetical protein